MDTDIALACLASGRAMLIGAECRRGVHACPPSSVGERTKRSMSGPPFALQVHLPTVACGATRRERSRKYQILTIIVIGLWLPCQVLAAGIDVFVGYADTE